MTDPTVGYLDVWRNCPLHLRQQVKDLWAALGVVPDEAEVVARLEQLCYLARHGDRTVGVSTASLGRLPQLRGDFFFFRCLVAPDYRRHGVARALAVLCRQRLERWSQEHPEARALGMAAVVESPALNELSRLPVWPASGLTLVGYADRERQIRVAWFGHARLAP